MIGDTQWPRDLGPAPRCDALAVLRAACAREIVGWDSLRAVPSRPGIAMRIDAGRGLTDRLGVLVDAILALAPPQLPLVLLPLVGPSFGFAAEGRFTLGDAAEEALVRLSGAGFPLGLLADALDTFCTVLGSPSATWKRLAADLAKAGVALVGAGAPFGRDLPSLLSAIWFLRASGRLAGDTHLRDLDTLPLLGFEWQFEPWDGDLEYSDGIVEGQIASVAAGGASFLAAANRCTDLRIQRRLRPGVDLVLHSDGDGWRAIDGHDGREESLDDAGAVARLTALPGTARAVLAIDPQHCVPPSPRPLPPVHPLPWPYDNFLAVASDVDWTTRRQAERTTERLCDELGLAFAGSAYLTSLSPRWPAWADLAGDDTPAAKFLAGQVADATLDTIHGLAWSFEAAVLAVGNGPWPAGAAEYRAPRPEPIADAAGLLLFAEGDTPVAWPELRLGLADRGWSEAIQPETTAAEGTGRAWGFYRLVGPRPITVEAIELGGGDAPELRSWRLVVARATRTDVATLLAELDRRGACPPVFTSHGGGQGTADWGQLRTIGGLSLLGYDGHMALDAPHSPFRALDLLQKAGVAFFNPMDILFSPDLPTTAELLRPETGQDGSRYYAFARYRSARWDGPGDGFAHHKHVATAQRFAATISELHHRFAWSQAPIGAILYTHLGHRIGSQDSPRLGWSEEAHMAWEDLAAALRTGPGADTGLRRLWVTTPAAVLALAATLRQVAAHLSVEPGPGDAGGLHVRSWFDECLGHAIPDPARWGTAWLHGLSLTLRASTAPRLFVDGRPIDSLVIDRDPISGVTILTVIDADRRQCLTSAPVTIAGGDDIRLAVAAGSLRNVGHWGCRIAGAVAGTGVALETGAGELFWARVGEGTGPAAWTLATESLDERAIWLALDGAAAGPRPTGHVAALHLRQPAGAPPLQLSGAWLARPRPGWRRGQSCAKGSPAGGCG